MKKRLAVWLLSVCWLSCGAWSQIPGNGSRQEVPARHEDAERNPLFQASAPNVSLDQKCSADAQNAAQKPADYPWSELTAPANIPNWVLALIAGVASWMAYRTLHAIQQQVDTFVSRERARITIEIDPLNPGGNKGAVLYDKSPMPPPSGGFWYVNLRVSNAGETSAFIRAGLCRACIRPLDWNPEAEAVGRSLGLPKVMRAGDKPFELRAEVESRDSSLRQVDQATSTAIGDGSLGVFVVGHVEFGDVFDNHWTIKMCRQWGGTWFGGEWQWASTWHDYPREETGPSTLNAEFRIKRPSMLLRTLRRLRKKDPHTPIIKIT